MSASIPSTRILDHIVHLTPPGTVQETAQKWRELGFTVLAGGKHLDGLTENNLVVLADGVYLELMSFVHTISHYPHGSPARHARETHHWATMANGWIDFAFLGTGSIEDEDAATRISDIISKREEKEHAGVLYEKEYRMGRKRIDGKELKWVMTNPVASAHGHGTLPFFCGDTTPRKWRVPSEPRSNTEHTSGTLGIAHLRLLAQPGSFSKISRQLTVVTGHEPLSSSSTEITWQLETGNKRTKAKLILSHATDEQEHIYLGREVAGVYEVGFRVERGRKAGSVYTPHGKIVWVPEVQ